MRSDSRGIFLAQSRPQPLKTLHLLRHAKAALEHHDGRDHERPLAKRGIGAARALAQHLQNTGFAVDRVFCSTARRTRETCEAIAPALTGASIAYRDLLYLVDTTDLMEFIQSLPDAADGVMIIGHNPTFHNLAVSLTKRAARGHTDELAAMKEKFSTGALCSLAFDVSRWRQVKAGSGTLAGFLRPRDLEGD